MPNIVPLKSCDKCINSGYVAYVFLTSKFIPGQLQKVLIEPGTKLEKIPVKHWLLEPCDCILGQNVVHNKN